MSTPPHVLIPSLEKIAKQRLHVLWTDAPIGKITEEVIKHQLRNGHPVLASIYETIPGVGSGNHAIVVVGFHAKDGKNTWEILNSNNTNQDGGYTTRRGLHGGSYSIWFE
jgi:dolichyl-phosphate-mannose--protein O-mannosyl transferase